MLIYDNFIMKKFCQLDNFCLHRNCINKRKNVEGSDNFCVNIQIVFNWHDFNKWNCMYIVRFFFHVENNYLYVKLSFLN